MSISEINDRLMWLGGFVPRPRGTKVVVIPMGPTVGLGFGFPPDDNLQGIALGYFGMQVSPLTPPPEGVTPITPVWQRQFRKDVEITDPDEYPRPIEIKSDVPFNEWVYVKRKDQIEPFWKQTMLMMLIIDVQAVGSEFFPLQYDTFEISNVTGISMEKPAGLPKLYRNDLSTPITTITLADQENENLLILAFEFTVPFFEDLQTSSVILKIGFTDAKDKESQLHMPYQLVACRKNTRYRAVSGAGYMDTKTAMAAVPEFDPGVAGYGVGYTRAIMSASAPVDYLDVPTQNDYAFASQTYREFYPLASARMFPINPKWYDSPEEYVLGVQEILNGTTMISGTAVGPSSTEHWTVVFQSRPLAGMIPTLDVVKAEVIDEKTTRAMLLVSGGLPGDLFVENNYAGAPPSTTGVSYVYQGNPGNSIRNSFSATTLVDTILNDLQIDPDNPVWEPDVNPGPQMLVGGIDFELFTDEEIYDFLQAQAYARDAATGANYLDADVLGDFIKSQPWGRDFASTPLDVTGEIPFRDVGDLDPNDWNNSMFVNIPGSGEVTMSLDATTWENIKSLGKIAMGAQTTVNGLTQLWKLFGLLGKVGLNVLGGPTVLLVGLMAGLKIYRGIKQVGEGVENLGKPREYIYTLRDPESLESFYRRFPEYRPATPPASPGTNSNPPIQ